jgi:hypothetical protein
LLEVVAATPNTSPKIETVPSSMPNTMVPADAISERFTCANMAAIVIADAFCFLQ